MNHARVVVLALPVLALSLLAPSQAQAQTVPSPYRYVEETQSPGVFTGYLITGRGDRNLGPHSAPIFGAAYTIRFAGPVSGEALVAGIPSRRTIHRLPGDDPTGDAPLVEVGETSALLALAHAGLKLNLTGPRTWRGIAPYALGGVGFTTDLAASPAEEEEIPAAQRYEFGPSFAVSLGAGTDWFASERLAVRVELRDFLWRVTTPPGFTAAGQEDSAWTHNFALTLGAALYF